MSTTHSPRWDAHSAYLAFIAFVFFGLGIVGTIAIWHFGTGNVTTIHSFWVPANARFLNEVGGTSIPVIDYTAARPVVTTDVPGLKAMSGENVIDVAVTEVKTGGDNPYVDAVVHYSTMVKGVQYYAQHKLISRRAETFSWEKTGTATFTGYHFAFPLIFCILWWALLFYFCFLRDEMQDLYRAYRRRTKKKGAAAEPH